MMLLRIGLEPSCLSCQDRVAFAGDDSDLLPLDVLALLDRFDDLEDDVVTGSSLSAAWHVCFSSRVTISRRRACFLDENTKLTPLYKAGNHC